MTDLPHASTAGARPASVRLGPAAGIAAGPLFLGLVLLNTWWSRDFLHSIGWRLFGGESLPYPSCLALGPHGWMQVVAFAVTGLLVVIFAIGLRRAIPRRPSAIVATTLLVLFGTAIATSSARVDWTSVHGGDPSTPNGWIHGISFVVALPSILLATCVLGLALRGDRRWRPFAVASPLVGVALVLSLVGGPHGQATFLVFLAILFGWIAALALRLRRVGP